MKSNKQTIGDILSYEQYNQFLNTELRIPAQIAQCEGSFKIIPGDKGEEFFNYIKGNSLILTFELATDTFKAIKLYFNAWRNYPQV